MPVPPGLVVRRPSPAGSAAPPPRPPASTPRDGPRAPLGALSLATSSSVRHPSNGSRFGCSVHLRKLHRHRLALPSNSPAVYTARATHTSPCPFVSAVQRFHAPALLALHFGPTDLSFARCAAARVPGSCTNVPAISIAKLVKIAPWTNLQIFPSQPLHNHVTNVMCSASSLASGTTAC